MAVPKSKVSKQRRNKRRSSVWKLENPSVTTCPKCGAFRLPHRMCASCMSYNGHEFSKAESTEAVK
ncbi:MAG: 50S ribosomal protein L32 [Oscillospiraceae bacterium]|nr:50S ribosomal protein L32 [Oscillospiraceae bacterium]